MSFQSYLEDDHSTHRMVGNNVIGNMQAIRASCKYPFDSIDRLFYESFELIDGGPEIINGCASGLASKFLSQYSLHPSLTAFVVLPRSASEAAVDEGNKFRQLPCRTFISVGTCPYRERCKFL